MPSLMQEFNAIYGNSDLIYTDNKAALASSGQELMTTLNRLFNIDSRCGAFFLKYNFVP